MRKQKPTGKTRSHKRKLKITERHGRKQKQQKGHVRKPRLIGESKKSQEEIKVQQEETK
ncbi:MAG: hypothetical protein NC400_13940 [Clostridium sp.]|nr:hypothetical protein [Clostridium sp.]